MKSRSLLTAISVFAAVSLLTVSAFASTDGQPAPVVFVRGLMMLQLERQDGLQVILPDAPGHDATVTFVMRDGTRRSIPFKGHNAITTTAPATTKPEIRVPELVRATELFGKGVIPRLEHTMNTVAISWSSIRTVTTEEVTPYRYTFIRKDTGEDIETFRPRKIAETIRIELDSIGQLDFRPLKGDISAEKVKEIWIEQVPSHRTDSADVVQQHFHHFMHYINRPAGQNFDVEPRRLNAAAASVNSRFAKAFWVDDVVLCGPFSLD